jgi:hypothetical protein
LLQKVDLVIPPILGRHFLVCVNRRHHLKVRLDFGRERLYVLIIPLAPPIIITGLQINSIVDLKQK